MGRFPGKTWAVAFMLLSSLSYSIMQMCSSICGGQIPAMEQLFFRNVASLLMYLAVRKKGISFLGTKAQQPALWAWSLSAALSVFFLFTAARFGDQAGLTIIGRTSGFLVVILAAVFLKEKITKVQVFAVILAFFGAALTANPGNGSGIGADPAALGLTFLSAVLSAVASICLGFLKNKVHALTVAIHFSVVSILISLPCMLPGFVTPQGSQWLLLAAIGIFGGLGQLTQMWSFERAPVGEINLYGYSSILFSMALGRIFAGESLTPGAVLGGGLVVLAGLWSYFAVSSKKEVSPS